MRVKGIIGIMPLPCKSVRLGVVLLLAATLPGAVPADAGTPEPGAVPPVSWYRLELAARKLFWGARVTIGVRRVPASTVAGELREIPRGAATLRPADLVDLVQVRSKLPFGRSEEATVWLDPATGAVLQSEKLTGRRRPYWKLRRYGPRGYFQWREAPANAREKEKARASWSAKSRDWVAWSPPPPANATVTSSYALLYLLSASRLDRKGGRRQLLLSSHGRLVELRFESGKASREDVGFDVVGPEGRRRRRNRILTRHVQGSARWLGHESTDEAPDTGFLGMRGPLSVLVEVGTGIPVRIEGRSKGIGRLVVRLRSVALR